MSELLVLALKFAFLALLWVFILFTGTVIRSDLFGRRMPAAVAPGAVATGIEAPFASEFAAARIQRGMAAIPSIAQASQLAASITFLLTDDATNLNGVILPSDGGWSAA